MKRFFEWFVRRFQCPERRGVWYEINVSDARGWHMFATDSRIRHYFPFQIARMILQFREAFPGCTITVTKWGGQMDPVVQAAIDGTVDVQRLNKKENWFRKCVESIRHADYVNETSLESV